MLALQQMPRRPLLFEQRLLPGPDRHSIGHSLLPFDGPCSAHITVIVSMHPRGVRQPARVPPTTSSSLAPACLVHLWGAPLSADADDHMHSPAAAWRLLLCIICILVPGLSVSVLPVPMPPAVLLLLALLVLAAVWLPRRLLMPGGPAPGRLVIVVVVVCHAAAPGATPTAASVTRITVVAAVMAPVRPVIIVLMLQAGAPPCTRRASCEQGMGGSGEAALTCI